MKKCRLGGRLDNRFDLSLNFVLNGVIGVVVFLIYPPITLSSKEMRYICIEPVFNVA